nr:alpha/beta hydrolase fold protein [Tanacetum cinerariifolium]
MSYTTSNRDTANRNARRHALEFGRTFVVMPKGVHKATINKYRWNPSIEVDVRRVFNKIGSKSFSDCMSKARKKAEKPDFMNQVTWEALCGVWRLPAFVAKSERGNCSVIK